MEIVQALEKKIFYTFWRSHHLPENSGKLYTIWFIDLLIDLLNYHLIYWSTADVVLIQDNFQAMMSNHVY